LITALLETFNSNILFVLSNIYILGNLKAIEIILVDLNRFIKKNLLNEDAEKNIFSFILYSFKNEKNKIEETIVDNLIKIYKDYISNWINYSKILDSFKMIDNLYGNLYFVF